MPAIHLLVNTFEMDGLGFEFDARLFEIVRSLRESGVVTLADDGSWAAVSRITGIEIPETVQTLLDARFERLEGFCVGGNGVHSTGV